MKGNKEKKIHLVVAIIIMLLIVVCGMVLAGSATHKSNNNNQDKTEEKNNTKENEKDTNDKSSTEDSDTHAESSLEIVKNVEGGLKISGYGSQGLIKFNEEVVLPIFEHGRINSIELDIAISSLDNVLSPDAGTAYTLELIQNTIKDLFEYNVSKETIVNNKEFKHILSDDFDGDTEYVDGFSGYYFDDYDVMFRSGMAVYGTPPSGQLPLVYLKDSGNLVEFIYGTPSYIFDGYNPKCSAVAAPIFTNDSYLKIVYKYHSGNQEESGYYKIKSIDAKINGCD